MATEIKAPTFPESVAEGTVAAWHKKPGDSVERDELIVEIETDKVVLEVVAPEAGTLTDVMAEEGDTVESEQVLGKIGEASGAGSKKESAASDDSAEKAESKEAAKPAGIGRFRPPKWFGLSAVVSKVEVYAPIAKNPAMPALKRPVMPQCRLRPKLRIA